MKIDAQVAAVIEMGRMAGVATPTIEMIYGLVRQRAINSGCYPGDPRSMPFVE
jgi:2-dehydropantoate 2-reductase